MTAGPFRSFRNAVGKVTGRQSDNVRFLGSEVQGRNRYATYSAGSWQAAMTFLRQQEIKEPSSYIVVETPEGNIGKDLISIFNERNSETLELGKRRPLPVLTKSDTHCSRCGYFVMPAAPLEEGVHYFVSLEQMQQSGQGLVCDNCASVTCAFCATIVGTDAPCPFCGEPMVTYAEDG